VPIVRKYNVAAFDGRLDRLETRTMRAEVAMISIIDDDVLVREATADLISSMGHEALTFASGEQFLTSGRLRDTACIITDLHMPGLDGLGLQRRLLAEGHTVPIIFITAYPKDAARTRALAAGAVAFLSKPFEERSLISALESALNRTTNLQR
jgi:FixJ family two-component response regulator